MPNCIHRFCYHQFSELPPTTEANLKTYSRQKWGGLGPQGAAEPLGKKKYISTLPHAFMAQTETTSPSPSSVTTSAAALHGRQSTSSLSSHEHTYIAWQALGCRQASLALYSPAWHTTAAAFPRPVYLTYVPITEHCTSSLVNKCHVVPTTGLLDRNSHSLRARGKTSSLVNESWELVIAMTCVTFIDSRWETNRRPMFVKYASRRNGFFVVKGPAAEATYAPQLEGLLYNPVTKMISFFRFSVM
jgi:hypothetical protein